MLDKAKRASEQVLVKEVTEVSIIFLLQILPPKMFNLSVPKKDEIVRFYYEKQSRLWLRNLIPQNHPIKIDVNYRKKRKSSDDV